MPKELFLINMPSTKSKIIQKNSGKLYCAKYPDLAGLFNKEDKEKRDFAEEVCEIVKQRFQNNGFFTTDELPAYGVSKEEKELILKETFATEGDLVVIFSYDYKTSLAIKKFLDAVLRTDV